MAARHLDAYERVYLGLAIVITTVWVIATFVQIIFPAHQVPTYANLVMMSVAGAFFGSAVLRSRSRTNGNGASHEDDPYSGPGGDYRAPR